MNDSYIPKSINRALKKHKERLTPDERAEVAILQFRIERSKPEEITDLIRKVAKILFNKER